MEKIVVTLGDRFALDATRLVARRTSTMPWLELIEPLIERISERAQGIERFRRHDGVPRSAPVKEAAVGDDALLEEWPAEGVPLPATTRQQLRNLVGPAADVARVHVGEHADAYARRERAEAVTVGEHIYFREKAFAPQEPAGFALLAHEVTHVAEGLRPDAAWRRATQSGVQAEERLARTREQAAMHPARSPVVAQFVNAAAPWPTSRTAPASAPVEVAHARPMKAEIDRAPIDAPTPPSGASPNLDIMRRTLFRDVMNQIRVEFERGA